MKVSIIIPCYNQVNYLKTCLESVLRQTYKDWCAIVVNDASTEGEVEKEITKIESDQILYVEHDENRGLAASRNTGISLSKTSVVVCVDADDLLADEFLEELMIPLLKEDIYDCSFGDIKCFGELESIWRLGIYDSKVMIERQWIPGAGTLIKKEFWERVGGYCEDRILCYGNEDWDFWLGAMENNIRVVHVAKPLYWYRIHSDSMNRKILSLHDYETRELIYARRKSLFDVYNPSASFLLTGYINSARAYKGIMDFRKAISLYKKAFKYASNFKERLMSVLDIFIPVKVRQVYSFILRVVLSISKRIFH